MDLQVGDVLSQLDAQLLLDGGTSPCGAGAAQVYSYPGPKQMVVCKGAAVSLCQADTLCSSTWHLCTATEYLDRGGTAPGYGGAWIQTCIRGTSNVTAPTDIACKTCVSSYTKPQEVMWDCSGGFGIEMSANHLSVSTATSCKRVGIDDPSTAGYWFPRSAGAMLASAACCYP